MVASVPGIPWLSHFYNHRKRTTPPPSLHTGLYNNCFPHCCNVLWCHCHPVAVKRFEINGGSGESWVTGWCWGISLTLKPPLNRSLFILAPVIVKYRCLFQSWHALTKSTRGLSSNCCFLHSAVKWLISKAEVSCAEGQMYRLCSFTWAVISIKNGERRLVLSAQLQKTIGSERRKVMHRGYFNYLLTLIKQLYLRKMSKGISLDAVMKWRGSVCTHSVFVVIEGFWSS